MAGTPPGNTAVPSIDPAIEQALAPGTFLEAAGAGPGVAGSPWQNPQLSAYSAAPPSGGSVVDVVVTGGRVVEVVVTGGLVVEVVVAGGRVVEVVVTGGRVVEVVVAGGLVVEVVVAGGRVVEVVVTGGCVVVVVGAQNPRSQSWMTCTSASLNCAVEYAGMGPTPFRTAFAMPLKHCRFGPNPPSALAPWQPAQKVEYWLGAVTAAAAGETIASRVTAAESMGDSGAASAPWRSASCATAINSCRAAVAFA